MIRSKPKLQICDHDFKNAIPYGNVDHLYPKCKSFIDPFEWWLGTNFTLVDCTPEKTKKKYGMI
jgi:hypothetical protein